MVKAARRAGWVVVERVLKTAPKGVVFCPRFHRYREVNVLPPNVDEI